VKDAVETVVDVIDTTARVAFVASGTWLVGKLVWNVMGSLLLGESEPPSGTVKAA